MVCRLPDRETLKWPAEAPGVPEPAQQWGLTGTVDRAGVMVVRRESTVRLLTATIFRSRLAGLVPVLFSRFAVWS